MCRAQLCDPHRPRAPKYGAQNARAEATRLLVLPAKNTLRAGDLSTSQAIDGATCGRVLTRTGGRSTHHHQIVTQGRNVDSLTVVTPSPAVRGAG